MNFYCVSIGIDMNVIYMWSQYTNERSYIDLSLGNFCIGAIVIGGACYNLWNMHFVLITSGGCLCSVGLCLQCVVDAWDLFTHIHHDCLSGITTVS